MRKTVCWHDLFTGHRVYSATAGSNVGHVWKITDTSSTGTPTYTPIDNATDSNGGLAVAFDNANEIQNVCVNFADVLVWDIDRLIDINFRVKMNQASVNAATSFAFGLQGDRNDAIDSIGYHASFRVVGSDSTTNVVVESYDGTTNKDDIATGTTLINAYKNFKISFANGTNDVRFFIDGQPVAESTTFNMSAYTSCLQPYFQLQKTAAAATDGFSVCYVEANMRLY